MSDLVRAINATLLPGFHGPSLPDWVAAELANGLGGVCLFGSNVVDAVQLRTLTGAIHAANPSALVAADEEGGDVSRLHHAEGSLHASASYLGRQDSVAATEATGYRIGAELRAAGIDLNLAPVADVNADPRNPVIGVRSFGADPELVARHVAAYTIGLQRAGVAACAKHFPGHGDTATDSHLDLPVVDADAETLAERELVPFVAAVAAGTLSVMTSHILVPALDPELPATLSPSVLGRLRTDLGFTGAIVSDALDMTGASGDRGIPEAAVLALAAGVDLLCIGAGNTAEQLAEIRARVAEAVQTGRLPEQRVFESAGRVAELAAAVARSRTEPAEAVPPPPLDAAMFWTRSTLPALSAPVLLKLDSPNNIAAAHTAWGIDEHLRAELDDRLPGATCLSAGDLESVRAALASTEGRPLVVQARDLGRVPFLSAAVALVRQARPDAIVAELGWPEPDQSWDVATFGAGRGVCRALVRLLAAAEH